MSIVVIPRLALLGITLLGPWGPAPVQDEEAEERPFSRPRYQFLRQNEDWSDLAGRDRSQTGDFFDPVKYMPLTRSESIWASAGGHLRFRVESWNKFNFGAPPGAQHSDTYLLSRFLTHLDVHVGEQLRIYAEAKGAYSTGRDLPGGNRPLDVDDLALQQLFADVDIDLAELGSVTVRPGRQMLLFGKQRLVSPLPWGNTLRTWDGVSGWWECEGWKVTGFWTQFAPVDKHDFNDTDRDDDFFGLYATGNLTEVDLDLDLYLLGRVRENQTFNSTSGDEERYTIGARVNTNFGSTNFDLDLEAAYQGGRVGKGSVDAGMAGGELGYTFSEVRWSPRPFVGFDYGSGDGSPGGNVGTFNQLYPLGHAYLGYIDTIGRQNILSANYGIGAAFTQKVRADVRHLFFWLDDNDDALYNAGGGVLVPGGTSTNEWVGHELDFRLNYRFDRHLQFLFGYSHFFTGSVIDDFVRDDDTDFTYLQATYTF